MTESETPPEEWRTTTKGRQYAVIKGPGGGTIFRKGDETIDQARARRTEQIEAKRNEARAAPEPPKRPRGKGRKPDPKPGPASAQAKTVKPKATRDQLAAAAEVPLAALGAFVGRQVLDCEFCSGAMVGNAGAAAKDLAASQNPYVISMLEWWHGVVSSFAGADGFASYLAPPIIHHVIPDPMAAFISPIMNIPARQPRPPRHAHSAPAGTPTPPGGAAPASSPPAGAEHTVPPEPGNTTGLAGTQEREALLQEQAELEARMRRMAQPNVPVYSAVNGDGPPPGPKAPPVDPAEAAGSPLPPNFDEGVAP